MINKSFQSVSFLSIFFLISNIPSIKPEVTINLTYKGNTITELPQEVENVSNTIKSILDYAEFLGAEETAVIAYPIDHIINDISLKEFVEYFLPLIEYLYKNYSTITSESRIQYLLDVMHDYPENLIGSLAFASTHFDVPEIFQACLTILAQLIVSLTATELLDLMMIYSIGECERDTSSYRALRFLDHYLTTYLIKEFPLIFHKWQIKTQFKEQKPIISLFFYNNDLITTSSKGTKESWNIKTASLNDAIPKLITTHDQILSPDGTKKIYIDKFSVEVRDLISDIKILSINDKMVTSVAFDATSSNIIVGFWDCTAAIYELKSQRVLHRLKNLSNVVSVCTINQDSTMLASATTDKNIIIWQAIPHGNNKNIMHFTQLLFILLLNKLWEEDDHLCLYVNDDWTQVLREIFYTFNQESQEYLIETYNIEF